MVVNNQNENKFVPARISWWPWFFTARFCEGFRIITCLVGAGGGKGGGMGKGFAAVKLQAFINDPVTVKSIPLEQASPEDLRPPEREHKKKASYQ